MDNDWLAYMATLADEIQAKMNRVRMLVRDQHWGEEGSYKESLVRSMFREFLPKRYEVSTGFVRWWEGQVSGQLDVVIWDAQATVPIMKEGNFVILPPGGVEAVIEVKSTLSRDTLRDALSLLHDDRWHCSVAQGPEHTPVRAILGFTHKLPRVQKTPTVACFEELAEFYAQRFPNVPGCSLCMRSRKVKTVSTAKGNWHQVGDIRRPRFLNAIDAICVIDECIVRNRYLYSIPESRFHARAIPV